MNFSSTMPVFACAYLYGYVDETGQNKQIDSKLTYFLKRLHWLYERGPFSFSKLLELHFEIFWWRVKIYEIRLNFYSVSYWIIRTNILVKQFLQQLYSYDTPDHFIHNGNNLVSVLNSFLHNILCTSAKTDIDRNETDIPSKTIFLWKMIILWKF